MKSNYNIDLSFVIPMYNTQLYIEECINSILKLDDLNIEIIVVDDGSTDRSAFIVEQYINIGYPIKLIKQSNMRAGIARNNGFSVAQGKYIAFIDSDDFIIPDAIIEMYLLGVNNEADFVIGRTKCLTHYHNKHFFFNKVPDIIEGEVLSGTASFHILSQNKAYTVMACNNIYRRDWLAAVGAKFHDIYHEDELWSATLFLCAEKVVATNLIHYMYREHRESTTQNFVKRKQICDLLFIVKCLLSRISDSKFNDTDFLSSYLINAMRLYTLAIDKLAKIRDSDFTPNAEAYLSFFIDNRKNISNNYEQKYLSYMNQLKYNTNLRESWLFSNCISHNDKLVNSKAKKIILDYNVSVNMAFDLGIDFSECFVTSDHKYLNDADIIVFYLPTLISDLEFDLDKRDNQIWVAVYPRGENNNYMLNNEYTVSFFDHIIELGSFSIKDLYNIIL